MSKQVLDVQWVKETKVFLCLVTNGKERSLPDLEIDGGLDEDEVMIAVFAYMDTYNIEMDGDCEIIFDGIAWEVV